MAAGQQLLPFATCLWCTILRSIETFMKHEDIVDGPKIYDGIYLAILIVRLRFFIFSSGNYAFPKDVQCIYGINVHKVPLGSKISDIECIYQTKYGLRSSDLQ